MRSIAVLLRAEWRERWLSWISLALLVALIGGTVLAGASAASRTSTAVPQFVSRYGYDAAAFGVAPFPRDFSRSAHVKKVVKSTYFFNGNGRTGGRVIPAVDLNVVSLPVGRASATIKLLSGHWPVGPQQILVGYSLQERYGLHVGSVVTVPLYRRSQLDSILNSGGNSFPPPHGPHVHFRVSGIEASLLDFPTTSTSYAIYTSRAFTRGEGRDVAFGYFAQVRLVDAAKNITAFQVYINHLGKQGNYFLEDATDGDTAALEGAIHPQVVGWWYFALFAALAGLALVGQALSRQSLAERASLPTLSALGLRRSQLFGVGMARAAVIGVLGALGALAAAFLLSPLTPVGEARAAETARGLFFEGSILGRGAPLILLVVVALAVVPSWRASHVRVATTLRDQSLAGGDSRVARGLGALGAPPSALIGVRNALERGRGRTSVPVATALAGSVLAVGALVASSVFGASLTNLLTTPRLYGANWQVTLEGMSTSTLHSLVGALDRMPTVTNVTYGGNGNKFIDVDGDPVQAFYAKVTKGSMVFSLASGHNPNAAGQIGLGQTVLSLIHAHDGSVVSATITQGAGDSRTSKVKVVGTVVIAPSVGGSGLGSAAVLTIAGIEQLACGTGPKAKACDELITKKLDGVNSWDVFIGVTHGAAGRATIAALDRRYRTYVVDQTLPTDLVNFGEAVDFPLLLSVTLAIFGVATLAHLLFVSVGRRRRQFALVKVLGFTRRQVRAALYWQAATVALVGIVLGVPLGIVAGKLIWRAFATSVGAVPFAVVSGPSIVYLALAIAVVSIALATVPAVLGARIMPAEALREA